MLADASKCKQMLQLLSNGSKFKHMNLDGRLEAKTELGWACPLCLLMLHEESSVAFEPRIVDWVSAWLTSTSCGAIYTGTSRPPTWHLVTRTGAFEDNP